MEDLKLFDDFERTDRSSYRKYNSLYNFLNSTSREGFEKLRKELQIWFNRYPSKNAQKLRADFKSNKDIVHISAFTELYIYHLLEKQGHIIGVESLITENGSQPDFEIDNGKFIIEVKAKLGDLERFRKEKEITKKVVNYIEKHCSYTNYLISIDILSYPKSSTSPKLNSIRSFIERVIKENKGCTSFKEIFGSYELQEDRTIRKY